MRKLRTDNLTQVQRILLEDIQRLSTTENKGAWLDIKKLNRKKITRDTLIALSVQGFLCVRHFCYKPPINMTTQEKIPAPQTRIEVKIPDDDDQPCYEWWYHSDAVESNPSFNKIQKDGASYMVRRYQSEKTIMPALN